MLFKKSRAESQMRETLICSSVPALISSSAMKISETAKRPMAATMMSNPSISLSTPKVYRCKPVGRSMPMVANISPKTVEIVPFNSESPARLLTVVRPKTIRAKLSAGPNCNAKRARGGPISIRKATESVPATNEPMAAIHSAGPARPCLAIW